MKLINNKKMNKNAPVNANIIKRLVLHFNVDKTIVMKDSIGYNNTDFFVKTLQYKFNIIKHNL